MGSASKHRCNPALMGFTPSRSTFPLLSACLQEDSPAAQEAVVLSGSQAQTKVPTTTDAVVQDPILENRDIPLQPESPQQPDHVLPKVVDFPQSMLGVLLELSPFLLLLFVILACLVPPVPFDIIASHVTNNEKAAPTPAPTSPQTQTAEVSSSPSAPESHGEKSEKLTETPTPSPTPSQIVEPPTPPSAAQTPPMPSPTETTTPTPTASVESRQPAADVASSIHLPSSVSEEGKTVTISPTISAETPSLPIEQLEQVIKDTRNAEVINVTAEEAIVPEVPISSIEAPNVSAQGPKITTAVPISSIEVPAAEEQVTSSMEAPQPAVARDADKLTVSHAGAPDEVSSIPLESQVSFLLEMM
ncbi:unnamed protein product [Cylicostephanus goldi]|uniref:Uncharacterized protein n=1 Tax=Cylicostephanus goldi TaxID=71465 RepID=A0A3P6Q5P1_CYLGO|nr:unnamed protein product [Cylicostephanus goldi]